jgi:hypothetical protein
MELAMHVLQKERYEDVRTGLPVVNSTLGGVVEDREARAKVSVRECRCLA